MMAAWKADAMRWSAAERREFEHNSFSLLVFARLQSTAANAAYFLNGLRARGSAYLHYVGYLIGPRFDSPESFRKQLEAETRS